MADSLVTFNLGRARLTDDGKWIHGRSIKNYDSCPRRIASLILRGHLLFVVFKARLRIKQARNIGYSVRNAGGSS